MGRRAGKTEMAINEIIKKSIESPGIYWYVAPSYKQVKLIVWERIKRILRVDESWKSNEVELSLTHPCGTKIELKGADKPDSLKGVGLKGVVLDECATMKASVWPEVIRPMLIDTNGWAFFIGTPKGRNWFFDIYKNQDKDQEWQSWNYPTIINKYISYEEIELSRKQMPEKSFHQEIMANFLEENAGVFRKVRLCTVGELQDPIRGEFYVMGVDLAKSEDFTVIIVMSSKTREVVFFERFQDVSWPEQKIRIQQIASKYNNALVYLDSTGVGDAIYDDLLQANISIEGYKFTNESKKNLIEKLQVAIEQRLITFPNIPELIDELLSFEYDFTAEGRIRYSAPDQKHDDCVIALALANWGIRHELYAARVIQEIVEKEEPLDRQGQGVPVYEFESESYSGY